MSKKKKKAPKGKKSNIKQITCIDCPRQPVLIVKQDECKACEYHKEGCCDFISPKQPIQIVSHGTPMKFNRTFFQSASRDIANSTSHYYLRTDIMREVAAIPGHPDYTKVKERFLAGDFKNQETKEKRRTVNHLRPVMSLALSNGEEPDILLEGKQYKITQENGKVEGDWEVLYYLYDMFGLDGFADMSVQGRQYKVRLSPIENSKESLVLVRQDNKLIIGSILK